MGKSRTPKFQTGEPCTEGPITIDGDVNVDISTEDINELVDAICDCIKENSPIVPACQPCILVDGVKDSHAWVQINVATGELEVFNLTGLLDPASVEIVTDPCDERCASEPCGEPVCSGTDLGCCECSTPEEKQAIATQMSEALGL